MAEVVDQTNLSDEEVARLYQIAAPITAVTTNASTIQITWAGNDAVLLFGRPQPLLLPDGGMPPFQRTEFTAIIHMSQQSLKDFSLVVANAIANYEARFGEIVTEFSRRSSDSQ
ncbi:hypothetical protein SAMN02745157_0723 [Kaistia soli DSM 19436]|uniref:DUF3467 domain-containing protein n=1 Tax=Kaistia soli DSM 19436 TaxID=1122133 RepID=A0A1M4VK49_9HYPH|nr:hypothetical protein [Kaistia soli]SHE69202.1 hypothetical protein SAMN02745157_0723 [Kaistia soli DSM 19436]